MAKRVFLIVLDSFGVGAEPDAPLFGDVGTNTLGAIAGHPNFRGDNLARLGMFNLDGVTCGTPAAAPIGSYARLREASAGKDTTIGHWEIAGLLSAEPLPTFPDGFPQELLDAFTAKTGYKVLCNKPYSGTDVIRDYGEEHMKTGALIVYTSADSVFQIAANEAIVPVEKLYEICAQARELLTGKYGVGRVIARPFVGDCAANFTRGLSHHSGRSGIRRPRGRADGGEGQSRGLQRRGTGGRTERHRADAVRRHRLCPRLSEPAGRVSAGPERIAAAFSLYRRAPDVAGAGR